MGRAMIGGILYGLPEVIFSGALLWNSRSCAVRRKDRHGNVLRTFPSWSWLAWDHSVDTSLWRDLHEYFEDANQRSSHPDGPQATDSIQIQRHFTFWKSTLKDKNPKKEKIHNRYYEMAQRKDIDLSHEVTPPGLRLRHPIPLAAEPVLPEFEKWDPVIQFRTTRVSKFIIGKCKPQAKVTGTQHKKWEPRPVPGNHLLTTTSGEVAGSIGYSSREPIFEGDALDLICIGRMEVGRRRSHMFEEAKRFHKECGELCQVMDWRDCRLPEYWKYKCYNVMWVEWENGIAYRRAIGNVFEHIWDTHCQEIDVRLG